MQEAVSSYAVFFIEFLKLLKKEIDVRNDVDHNYGYA
jgi:hypothetical protein